MRQSAVKRVSRLSAAILLLGAVFTRLGGVCLAQSTNISEFPITATLPALPEGITFGSDNAYWFTLYDGAAIGRIDTVSNVITEIAVNANPFSIVSVGTNLWFTEAGGNSIGHLANFGGLTTTSNYTHYPLTNANSQPWTMIIGPDTNFLWFIEFNLSKIAAVNINNLSTNANGSINLARDFGPFGTNTLNGSPGKNAAMFGLATGPDGNIWFTQGALGAVGYVSTNGTVTNVFQLPNATCEPSSLALGPDGALWFTEFLANKIGRITTNSIATNSIQLTNSTGPTNFFLTEYSVTTNVGAANVGAYGIIRGPDNNLWFSEYYGSAIGSITTNGIVTIFPTPTASVPTFLATGDGNIWFGNFSSGGSTSVDDQIGEFLLAPVTLSASATSTNLVLSWHGSNFALMSATNLGGPWTNVTGAATSPYTNPIVGPQQFFKLKSK